MTCAEVLLNFKGFLCFSSCLCGMWEQSTELFEQSTNDQSEWTFDQFARNPVSHQDVK